MTNSDRKPNDNPMETLDSAAPLNPHPDKDTRKPKKPQGNWFFEERED